MSSAQSAVPKSAQSAAPSQPASGARGPRATGAAAGGPQTQDHTDAQRLDVSVERHTLKNGLRLLLSRDAEAQTVAVCTTYDAGARRDPERQPGLARVVQQLVQEGTRDEKGAPLAALVQARGGATQNVVHHDFARYCTVLPKTEIEVALWLEAGRMGRFEFTENDLQRAVHELGTVYLDSIGSTAYARGERRLQQLAFQRYVPYEHPVLPRPGRLRSIPLDAARAFYRMHYRSNHAVMSIVGDFDPAAMRRLVEQHVGDDKFRGSALGFSAPALSRQTSERMSMIEDANAKTPAAVYGWPVESSDIEERRALSVVAALLGRGETSLLHDALVRKKGIARHVDASRAGLLGPDLLSVQVYGTEKAQLELAEKELDGALSRLRHSGPTPTELEAAKRRLEREMLAVLAAPLTRAEQLSVDELAGRDATQIEQRLSEFEAVTAADVRQVVQKYLFKERRTVVELYPKGWQDPYQAPMPRYHIVRPGENLTVIAKQWGTSVEAVAKMNGISPQKAIYPGQKLRVPAGKGQRAKKPDIVHTVKKGDTLSEIGLKYGVSMHDIARANGMTSKTPIRIGQKLRIPRK